MKTGPSKPIKRVRLPKPNKVMGRPKLYPWDKWLAPHKVRLTIRSPRHYTCSTPNMVQRIRNESSKRGLSVHVRVEGDAIFVTFNRKIRKS